MSEWRTASTRASTTKAKVTGASGQVMSPPIHRAAGQLHAYRPGERTTACRRDLGGLKLWPTEDFMRGYDLHRCPDCVAQAHN